jgi:hypothetical protein
MKITKALLLSAVVIASACSDDDDKKSSLESAKLSFTANTKAIEAPEAMQNSDNEYAQMANGWVQVANGMTQYLGYMEAPAGATKSSSRITAGNARAKAGGDVLVYTWTDEQTGYSIGYQISEESDKYVFEIFLRESGSVWVKYFYAEEKKDRSAGLMEIYNIWGDNTSEVIFKYAWTRSGDILTLTFSDSSDESSLVITVNEKTGAGSVTSFNGNIKTYEMIWDAQGNGTWTYYDAEGNVDDSGTWEA